MFTSAFLAPGMTFLLGLVLAMLASQRHTDKASQLQRQIAQKGLMAQGTILGVWKPPLAGSFARIYFEFAPEGGTPVRCCHIDRRAMQHSASLPAPGANVSVRYLPENPGQAVIAKLVSRFV